MSVDDVLTELTALSEPELRRVRDAAISLLGDERKQSVNSDVGHAWGLVRRIVPTLPPWQTARHKRYMRQQGAALDYLMSEAEQACPTRRGEDVDKIAAYFVRAVVWHLHEQNINVTPSTVLMGLNNLGAAIESMFPGYAQARLLGPMILKSKKSPTSIGVL